MGGCMRDYMIRYFPAWRWRTFDPGKRRTDRTRVGKAVGFFGKSVCPRVCVYLSRTGNEYRFHQMSEPLEGQSIHPTLPYLTLPSHPHDERHPCPGAKLACECSPNMWWNHGGSLIEASPSRIEWFRKYAEAATPHNSRDLVSIMLEDGVYMLHDVRSGYRLIFWDSMQLPSQSHSPSATVRPRWLMPSLHRHGSNVAPA